METIHIYLNKRATFVKQIFFVMYPVYVVLLTCLGVFSGHLSKLR